MEPWNVLRLLLFGLIVVLVLSLLSCNKEHSEYRYKPKFKVGQLVQYEKSIQHDYAEPGKRMWDTPQPLKIDSFYFNETWRDNWYFYTDNSGVKHESAIDELSLQEWNGTLQK